MRRTTTGAKSLLGSHSIKKVRSGGLRGGEGLESDRDWYESAQG